MKLELAAGREKSGELQEGMPGANGTHAAVVNGGMQNGGLLGDDVLPSMRNLAALEVGAC